MCLLMRYLQATRGSAALGLTEHGAAGILSELSQNGSDCATKANHFNQLKGLPPEFDKSKTVWYTTLVVAGRRPRCGMHRNNLEHLPQLVAANARRGFFVPFCTLPTDVCRAFGASTWF